ncbi:uncharacterized protein LOC129774053 [Toxorhynchites rutilus septentrionalis]|uniref:uncharacterized protein LOC129774053 n=1 Tax=Toxorhynchites rutilus septentrionalis TaxID=329112 RepID=UPI002479D719|nr:uncharacterized protein LOC129774053 [Toxorhynchites rutilus septentrionalis]
MWTHQLFATLVIFLFITFTKCEMDLPEYLHVCHRDDPKLTECMKQSIETLRPYLARGIPELDIPSIEPINLGDLIVAESVPGQGISITAKDIKAYGPSNFRLKKLSVVEYGKVYSFELELPHLYVEGRYVVDGRIILLPVKGAGKFTGNFTQGVGNVRIKGDRKVINGKNHLSLAKLDIKIRVGDGKIKLENLFGGDRTLGEIINQTINQNFSLISHELIPLIEKALQRIFKRTGNKILERFPEEVLFPWLRLRHVNKSLEFWKRIILSHESNFELLDKKRGLRMRRKIDDGLQDRHLQPTMNLSALNGIMAADGYIDILCENLEESMLKMELEDKYTFQQDKNPMHSAKETAEFFPARIKLMVLTPQSPDLNPRSGGNRSVVIMNAVSVRQTLTSSSSVALGVILALLLVELNGVVQAKEIVIRNKDFPQLKEKPDWLRVCRRENPNEDDCFRKMFVGTFPYIAKGIPEIGVQPFDPLRIESVQVSRGSGALTLSGGFKKLNIKGPSNTTVRRASLDFKTNTLSFDLEIPKLKIDAVYNLKGNVLLLPLVGDGDVTMVLKDVKTSVVTKISVRPMPEDAIFIEEMKVTFLVGGMRIHLDNLFQGNQVLGASLNLFLNQNANEVIAELRTDLEYGLADIFIGLWNELFNKLPLKLWIDV